MRAATYYSFDQTLSLDHVCIASLHCHILNPLQLPSLLDLILAQVSVFTTGEEFAALTQSTSLSHDTSTLLNPHALPVAEGLNEAMFPLYSNFEL